MRNKIMGIVVPAVVLIAVCISLFAISRSIKNISPSTPVSVHMTAHVTVTGEYADEILPAEFDFGEMAGETVHLMLRQEKDRVNHTDVTKYAEHVLRGSTLGTTIELEFFSGELKYIDKVYVLRVSDRNIRSVSSGEAIQLEDPYGRETGQHTEAR
nr:hypothetical protein [Clostridia bacterium]